MTERKTHVTQRNTPFYDAPRAELIKVTTADRKECMKSYIELKQLALHPQTKDQVLQACRVPKQKGNTLSCQLVLKISPCINSTHCEEATRDIIIHRYMMKQAPSLVPRQHDAWECKISPDTKYIYNLMDKYSCDLIDLFEYRSNTLKIRVWEKELSAIGLPNLTFMYESELIQVTNILFELYRQKLVHGDFFLRNLVIRRSIDPKRLNTGWIGMIDFAYSLFEEENDHPAILPAFEILGELYQVDGSPPFEELYETFVNKYRRYIDAWCIDADLSWQRASVVVLADKDNNFESDTQYRLAGQLLEDKYLPPKIRREMYEYWSQYYYANVNGVEKKEHPLTYYIQARQDAVDRVRIQLAHQFTESHIPFTSSPLPMVYDGKIEQVETRTTLRYASKVRVGEDLPPLIHRQSPWRSSPKIRSGQDFPRLHSVPERDIIDPSRWAPGN